MIHYMPHKEIDRAKWDACMDRATNSLVYGYSFYLDIMARTWDALVMDDYTYVMPLPSRKKMGLPYLFQPFLTPCLGVFGEDPDIETVHAFIKAIPAKYKLWDISFNFQNRLDPGTAHQYRRENFVLSLVPSYEQLQSGYSKNLSRNINKAQGSGLEVKRGIDLSDIVKICREEWPSFTQIEPGNFEGIINNARVFTPWLKTYGVSIPGQDEWLATCAFLVYGRRAYYWLVGNRTAAKATGASPLLLDQFIRDHAGSGLLLDFEGSDKKTIAEFYQRFGASEQPFTTLYQNRLPFPMNLLKPTPRYYRALPS